MIRKADSIVITVLLVAAYCNLASGQATPAALLEVDIENFVECQNDIADPSKLAANPNATPVAPPRNFFPAATLGDIVAVNGQPAKGTYSARTWVIGLNPAPSSGQAIADTTRTAIRYATIEILKNDGTLVGTIMVLGSAGGSPTPPGAPLAQASGNFAIVGGTGAFLGARGQYGQVLTAQTVAVRLASMAEDPGNRRVNGGGRVRYLLHLIPLSTPQVVTTAAGPAVFHADFSQVTAAKPAKAGEVVILRATGLGPTRPGTDPGQPFPLDALQEINSPVGVTVNGQAAEVINKIGWPGLLDTYRVDFRVPDGIATGTAAIQLTAAWIAGSAVNIPVQ